MLIVVVVMMLLVEIREEIEAVGRRRVAAATQWTDEVCDLGKRH